MESKSTLYAELNQDLVSFYADFPEQYHPFLVTEHQDMLNSIENYRQADAITRALFSEILTCRLGFNRDNGSRDKYYTYVCDQLYCFFTGKGYAEEVYTASALKEMFITTAAVAIVQETGWNPAFVTAAVTLVVSTAVKIGIRSWCRYYEDTYPDRRREQP